MTINRNAIEQLEKKITKRVEDRVRKTAIDVWSTVNTATTSGGGGSPVLTSRYIKSHRINTGAVDTSVHPVLSGGTGGLAPDPGFKGQSVGIAENEMKAFKLGQNVFITDSVPYAGILERGGSRKTPQGIYGPAVQSLKRGR